MRNSTTRALAWSQLSWQSTEVDVRTASRRMVFKGRGFSWYAMAEDEETMR